MNTGHITHEDCKRNAEACRESARAALGHSERHRLAGHPEAARDWKLESDQAIASATFWREQALRLEPVGNPVECDMR